MPSGVVCADGNCTHHTAWYIDTVYTWPRTPVDVCLYITTTGNNVVYNYISYIFNTLYLNILKYGI